LFADGRETAVAVIFAADTVASPAYDADASTNDDDKLCLSLSSGTLTLVDDAGSMA
jgi:hypothetical protein